MKVLVFDTETTGLPEERNASLFATEKWPYIVQLSYILYDTETKKMLKCKDDIIQVSPYVKISPESIAIHGITPKMCARKGVPIMEALTNFNAIIQEADLIVGHNICFDKNMLIVESVRQKVPHYFSEKGWRKPEVCTMRHFIIECAIERVNVRGEKYFKFPTLVELHTHLFNVTPKNAHDSMADVLICLRCYAFGLHGQDIAKEGGSALKELYNLYCI
jgi:DNA polymerase-3 subunit epsilon